MVTNRLFDEYVPDQVEEETRRRIKVAVWAYAYEFENVSLVADEEFDREALTINLNVRTNRPDLDEWFIKNFSPHTGQWIHQHPQLASIKAIYEKYHKENE